MLWKKAWTVGGASRRTSCFLVHARLQEAEALVGVDGGELGHHRVGLGIADRRVGDVVLGQLRG